MGQSLLSRTSSPGRARARAKTEWLAIGRRALVIVAGALCLALCACSGDLGVTYCYEGWPIESRFSSSTGRHQRVGAFNVIEIPLEGIWTDTGEYWTRRIDGPTLTGVLLLRVPGATAERSFRVRQDAQGFLLCKGGGLDHKLDSALVDGFFEVECSRKKCTVQGMADVIPVDKLAGEWPAPCSRYRGKLRIGKVRSVLQSSGLESIITSDLQARVPELTSWLAPPSAPGSVPR